MGASTGVKKAIRKQILYIFADYIIIFTILFMVDVVSVVKNLIIGYSNQLDIIPSIILYIVTIFLLLPPVSNIINRLRAISGLLAATINGDNVENRELSGHGLQVVHEHGIGNIRYAHFHIGRANDATHIGNSHVPDRDNGMCFDNRLVDLGYAQRKV